MILTKEQINRYLRHIIIPEISGAGQKKLLESKVHISAFCAEEAAALVLYLAAAGVGHMECSFVSLEGFEQLSDDIRNLNNEVHIGLTAHQAVGTNEGLQSLEGFSARMAIGKTDDLLHILKISKANKEEDWVPLIAARSSGWIGDLQVIRNQQQLDDLIYELNNDMNSNAYEHEASPWAGDEMSLCLLGALATIEFAKLYLGIGTVLESRMKFDLLSMNFMNEDIASGVCMEMAARVDGEAKSHDEVNMKTNLSHRKALIVGAGGLGCPAAFALARAGIGTIGLMDQDQVDISNLNRQILHTTSRIGMSKVESAKLFIQQHYPDVNVVTYAAPLHAENAMDIVGEYDVVLDCVDNFPTRYLINDACYFAGKPLVDAAAVQFCGLILTILPNSSVCYRCVFPEEKTQNKGMSCSEAGVFGPVPGVLGFLQATEAMKVLLGVGELLTNRIVYFDAMNGDFDMLHMSKSKACSICGESPSIDKLMESQNFCRTGGTGSATASRS